MAFDLVRAVSFYALAGCVHELAHVLAYAFVVLGGVSDFGAVSFACPVEQHGGVRALFREVCRRHGRAVGVLASGSETRARRRRAP